MAYVHHYDHIHDVPLARRPRRRRETAEIFRDREYAELIDLEFSNAGRNPRFPAGWFILPAVVTGMAVLAAVALLV
jgi:hypothetical protein